MMYLLRDMRYSVREMRYRVGEMRYSVREMQVDKAGQLQAALNEAKETIEASAGLRSELQTARSALSALQVAPFSI
jgi:hypothetical protein